MTLGVDYAKALYSLAEEEGLCDVLLEELSELDKVLFESPSYIRLLDTPALKKDEKLKLIDEAFSSLNEYVLNMLKLLCEEREVSSVPDILKEYKALYDKAHNITRVDVITAIPMTDGQRSQLVSKLSSELKSEVILSCTVDKSILGGVILRYSGTQTDASIKARLDALSARIKDTIV